MIELIFSEDFREIWSSKKPPHHLCFRFEVKSDSIKHAIEHFGIPHTEVGHILLRGRELAFNYKPNQDEQIFVEALKGPVDVTQTNHLRSVAFEPNRFIVDECVARLAAKLRMRGCDVLYNPLWDDADLAKISAEEKRVLLTRDRGLLMRKEVIWGRFVRGANADEQLSDVIKFFGVKLSEKRLKRCLVCNGELEPVEKEKILDQLEPLTKLHFQDFSQCPSCRKIYWEGSHYRHIQKQLRERGI